jgi:CDGSH-type Zn-finger protein
MKRILSFVLVMAALLCLPYIMADDRPAEAAKPAAASCRSCHADFASLLPQGHPPAQGTNLAACTSCHVPDREGTAKKNAFSSRLHKAHVVPKGPLDCTACHTWVPGKNFGLIGQKGYWGAPTKEEMGLMKQIFTSWASSSYTDNLHAKVGIACAQCHGKRLPKADDTVENSRCLACHGPMDTLAQKTEPKDFKDRNPHKSHLGDIACTVCHKGHSESKIYCLGCHQNFKMKIQGEKSPAAASAGPQFSASSSRATGST